MSTLIENLLLRRNEPFRPSIPEIIGAKEFQRRQGSLPQPLTQEELPTVEPQIFEPDSQPLAAPTPGPTGLLPNVEPAFDMMPNARIPRTQVGQPEMLGGVPLSLQTRQFAPTPLPAPQNSVEPFLQGAATGILDESPFQSMQPAATPQVSWFQTLMDGLQTLTGVPAGIAADTGRLLGLGSTLIGLERPGDILDRIRQATQVFTSGDPLGTIRDFASERIEAGAEYAEATANPIPTSRPDFLGGLGGSLARNYPFNREDVPNSIRALMGADYSFMTSGGLAQLLDDVDDDLEMTPEGFNPFGILRPSSRMTAAQDLGAEDAGAREVRRQLGRNLRFLDFPTALIGAPLEFGINLGVPEELRIDVPRASDWLADRLTQLNVDPSNAIRTYIGFGLDATLTPFDVLFDNLIPRVSPSATAPVRPAQMTPTERLGSTASGVQLELDLGVVPDESLRVLPTPPEATPTSVATGQLSIDFDPWDDVGVEPMSIDPSISQGNSQILDDPFATDDVQLGLPLEQASQTVRLPRFPRYQRQEELFSLNPYDRRPIELPLEPEVEPEYVQLDLSSISPEMIQMRIPFDQYRYERAGRVLPDQLRRPFWFDYGRIRNSILEGADNETIISDMRDRGVYVDEDIINRVISEDITDEALAEAADIPMQSENLPAPPANVTQLEFVDTTVSPTYRQLESLAPEVLRRVARDNADPDELAAAMSRMLSDATPELIRSSIDEVLRRFEVPARGTPQFERWRAEFKTTHTEGVSDGPPLPGEIRSTETINRVDLAAGRVNDALAQITELDSNTGRYSFADDTLVSGLMSDYAAERINLESVRPGNSVYWGSRRSTPIRAGDRLSVNPRRARVRSRALPRLNRGENVINPIVEEYVVTRVPTDAERVVSSLDDVQVGEFYEFDGKQVRAMLLQRSSNTVKVKSDDNLVYSVPATSLRRSVGSLLTERANDYLTSRRSVEYAPPSGNTLEQAVDDFNAEPSIENLSRVSAETQQYIARQYEDAVDDFNQATDKATNSIEGQHQPVPIQSEVRPPVQETVSFDQMLTNYPRTDARLADIRNIIPATRAKPDWNRFLSLGETALRRGDPDLLVSSATQFLEAYPRSMRTQAVNAYNNFRSLMLEMHQRAGVWLPEDLLPDLGDICD